MGQHSCCNQQKVKRGLWSPEEDEKLINYITTHGYGCWSDVPQKAGLQRCGKSCRLRWINYLRPDIRRGRFSPEEEKLIINLHKVVGNRWAHIASHLPGRTDNEIKNYWNSWIKKKIQKPNPSSSTPKTKLNRETNNVCHSEYQQQMNIPSQETLLSTQPASFAFNSSPLLEETMLTIDNNSNNGHNYMRGYDQILCEPGQSQELLPFSAETSSSFDMLPLAVETRVASCVDNQEDFKKEMESERFKRQDLNFEQWAELQKLSSFHFWDINVEELNGFYENGPAFTAFP